MSQETIKKLGQEALKDAFAASALQNRVNETVTASDGHQYTYQKLEDELLRRLNEGETNQQLAVKLQNELKDVREMYRALLKASQDR